MKKLIYALACIVAAGFFAFAAAQKKVADYKLSRIKVVPFEKRTGEFEAEIADKDESRAFFNEISKTYLVTIEVAGAAGSFETGRKIEIVVTENGKVKTRKLEQIDLIGDDGKIFMPLWIDAPLCGATTVSARIVGQRAVARLQRKLTVFQCGE